MFTNLEGRVLDRLERVSLARIAGMLGILYLLVALTWPAGFSLSPDCDAKVVQVLSLRFEHGFHLDYRWPGLDIDPARRMLAIGWTYVTFHDGELHFVWSTPFALASWPFFVMFGRRGLFLVPAVCGACSAGLTGALAERVRRGTGSVAALVVGLGTPVFFYGTQFWEHTPALAVALAGTLLLVRDEGSSARVRGRRFAAGVLLAAAAGGVRTDFYVYAAAVVLGALVAWSWRERLSSGSAVVLGAVVGSLPWFALNRLIGGRWLSMNAVHNQAPVSLGYLRDAHIGVLAHYLVGMTIPAVLRWATTLAAVGALLVFAVRPRRSFVWHRLALGAYALASLLAASLLVAHTDARLHGWLLASPVLLLCMLRTQQDPVAERPTTGRALRFGTAFHLLANFALLVVSYPNGFSADGNVEWGPRYYLGIFPLLAALTAPSLVDLLRTRPLARGALAVLIVSVGIELEGIAVARGVAARAERLARLTAGPDDLPLVTDFWPIPATNPVAMMTRPSFVLLPDDSELFAELVGRLAARGIRRVQFVSFSTWEEHPFRARVGAAVRSVRVDETDLLRSTLLELGPVQGTNSSSPRE